MSERTCWACYYCGRENSAWGYCRRKPPRVVNVEAQIVTRWPRVERTDWCNEFVDEREGKWDADGKRPTEGAGGKKHGSH